MSGEEYVSSENGSGSDNSYVQVTSEEAATGPLIDIEEPGKSGVASEDVPPMHVDDDSEEGEDIYGSGNEEEKDPEEAQPQEVAYKASLYQEGWRVPCGC